MPLNDFESDCDQKAPIIVSRDKHSRRQHKGKNPEQNYVTHYRVDGYVLTEGKRCDFLLINEDKKKAYLIELKGSDLTAAAEQLEATQAKLAKELEGYDVNFRIAANKCKTQEIENGKFRKFRRQHGRNLKFRTGNIEEDI